jgi:hypothetical protein
MSKKTILLALMMVPLLLGLALAAPATHGAASRGLAGDGHKAAIEGESCDGGQPQGFKSAAIKKAIRTLAKMLRSKKLDTVLSWLKNQAGIGVAKTVRKHARTIADTLDDLLKWERLSMQMVRDQTTAALKAVRVPESLARETAFWIEKFISWTLL